MLEANTLTPNPSPKGRGEPEGCFDFWEVLRPHPNPLPKGEGMNFDFMKDFDLSLSPWERVRVRA
jgi:hypothetical protein